MSRSARAVGATRAVDRAAFPILSLMVLAAVGCHDNSSPVNPVLNLAGTYTLTTTRQCPGEFEPDYVQTQTVVLTQTGNQINFLLGVDTGGAGGTIHGNTIDLEWQDGVIICSSQLKGTATIAGASIRGSVSGQPSGAGCDCNGKTLTISFSLTKQ